MGAILGALKSIFSALQALFGWLAQSQLIEAGKAEAERDALLKQAQDTEVADAIDRQPPITDADALLDRLWGPKGHDHKADVGPTDLPPR